MSTNLKPSSIYLDGEHVHIHVNRKALTEGDPCIQVTDKVSGERRATARGIRLAGVWDIVHEEGDLPCGASVVLETSTGVYRLLDAPNV